MCIRILILDFLVKIKFQMKYPSISSSYATKPLLYYFSSPLLTTQNSLSKQNNIVSAISTNLNTFSLYCNKIAMRIVAHPYIGHDEVYSCVPMVSG